MPYDWLKQIPTSLLQLDEIPLTVSPLPFPWEELSKAIGEVFQIPDFRLEPSPLQWLTNEELVAGMGSDLKPLTCTIPSFEGLLCLVMSTPDVQRLMSLLLNDSHHENDILDEEFLQGFYYFAAYEVIHLLTKLSFGNALSPQIQKNGQLPTEACLSADIKIHLRGKTIIARILISSALRRSWKEKHAERSLELPIHSSLAEKLTLPVHIEVGRTTFKPSEWKTVKCGDFVLLDSCSINPYDEKGGRVTLTINGIPFYIGKIKDGNIKILDHPLYSQQEDTNMSNIPPDKSQEDHDDLSMDFDTESFDSEIESEHEHGTESEHISEELSEESQAPSEEHSETEEEHTEEHEEDELVASKTIPAESPLKIENIPLSVIVEVGRLQMSVKKILELQPGNLLELDVHPENGVDLVVNGKRIAKGELVKLGEALGVRILDIS